MRRLTAIVLTLLLAPAAPAQPLSIRQDHPRLLIHRDEIDALRKRCGLPGLRDAPPASQAFATQQAAFERVRRAADAAVRFGARPGELYAVALAHLVLGRPDRRDAYVDCVEAELRRQIDIEWRADDVVVALDWCWDALSEDVRNLIAARLAARMQPCPHDLDPLDHLALHPRVCDIAAAIVLHEPGPSARAGDAGVRIAEVLRAAGAYLEGPFVRLWQRKGPAASSPTNAIWSEADAVLAAEIWHTGAGRSIWPMLADSLGRCTDVHFWSYTGHKALPFGFPWNDGGWSPDRPGRMHTNWAVAVPWVLAARTNSGTARWFTSELPEPPAFAPGARDDPAMDALCWSRVIYGDAPAPPVLRQACPLARPIPKGLLVMRTDWSPEAAVVMANVGQPYWRSGQHFNAGHFQIYRAGRLTTGSDEDVAADAIPARGGDAHLDDRIAEWELFSHATIAHNCITVADPRYTPSRRGRPWPARGNQRLIDRGALAPDLPTDDVPVEDTILGTGRLLAFETNSFYSYAAANLTLAYPAEVVRSAVRHFLLLNAGALLVCDHIITVSPEAVPTWHLHLPDRPRLAIGDLDEKSRVAGLGPAAGIWMLPPDAGWITVTQGEGRLFVRTLLPADARIALVGGPRQPMRIPRGTWAGEPYFGSDAKGFEHRLWPAWFADAPQAWYRLGEPRALGPQFGLRSNWGRLDVAEGTSSPPQTRPAPTTGASRRPTVPRLPRDERAGPRQPVPAKPAPRPPATRPAAPARPDRTPAACEHTFLHVLVPTEARADRPPPIESVRDDDLIRIVLAMPAGRCEVMWSLRQLDGGGQPAGTVVVVDPKTDAILYQGDLTTSVATDKPLPGERR